MHEIRTGLPGVVGDLHILVFQPDSSARIPLPSSGDWVISTRPPGDLVLEDLDQEECRLKIRLEGNSASVVDISPPGAKGILLNGDPLVGRPRLVSGDILGFGKALMVFHGQGQIQRPAPLSFDQFLVRLFQECERSSRTGTSLGLLSVDLGQVQAEDRPRLGDLVTAAARLMDLVAWDQDGGLMVLFPDTDERIVTPAGRILAALSSFAPEARAGYSLCPQDGVSPDVLIAGARRGARHAPVSGLVSIRDTTARVQVGKATMIVSDPAMVALLELVKRLAGTDLPVLVNGQTGVGKELVAQALHYWSARNRGPLITVNCAAIAQSLFEAELFGHVKGAYTGATESRPGLLESAAGGTIFLDEIGEAPLGVQAKLLRVLETHRISRVGSSAEIPVDIRIVAATNRDLEADVAAGQFRRDLFFRLAAAVVVVPSLAERPLEIPVLAREFLFAACRGQAREAMELSPDAARRLQHHTWPGNVRELKNLMEVCAATVDGRLLRAGDLPPRIASDLAPWLQKEKTAGSLISLEDCPFGPDGRGTYKSLKEEIRELERIRILQALEATDGVQIRAAELLGMPLRTFITRLREFKIPRRSSQKGD